MAHPHLVSVTELSDLSAREAEVLELLAAGLSNDGIAATLYVSGRTVDAHVRSIFLKLNLFPGPDHNRRVRAALVWFRAHAEVRDSVAEQARTA